MSNKISDTGAREAAAGNQDTKAHAPVSAEGAQVVVPGPGDVVTLPAGVNIVSLEADGRDLLIVLDDGEKILVPDGAIVVPEIVVDGTVVPPTNIAALLIDSEVQPAAGPPLSSGGNFATDEGAIQAAYDLGNLLPYTELQFGAQPNPEIIPGLVDREPGVVIETPDNPVGAVSAIATVYEAGLPVRNGEPAGTGEAADGNGSNDSDTREATGGTIVFDAPDGTKAVLINGVAIDHTGQTFTSPMGTMTITSIDLAGGKIGFTYLLADNLLNQPSDGFFQMTVVDSDGDEATATLTINVVDDAPIAANDTDTLAAGAASESGNVISGAGTTSGATGADLVGADNASVTSVSHGATSVTATAGTMVIAGDYGSLTLHADGSYTYVRNANGAGGATDQFTYTLTDGDGSTDTATLTIQLPDSGTTLRVPVAGEAGTEVHEDGLAGPPAGSAAAGDGEFTSGTIAYTAPDGPAVITINGTPVSSVGDMVAGKYGTLTVTGFANGTITYTYELTTNTAGDATSDPFSVVVTDADGDHSDATLVVSIVDDVATAHADADSVTEDGPLVADGNVLTGSGGADANTSDGVADVAGADGAHVTAVAFGGTAGTVGTALAGAYGSLTLNADGSYSYALDNGNALVQGLDKTEHLTETFTYTITDGDGDTSTTTLTITVNGADDGVTIGGLNPAGAEQTVFENDLADGSSPDAAALTQAGTFTVTAQDGVSTISVGGHVVYTGGAFVAGQTIATAYGTLTITGVTPTTTDANGDVTAATVAYSYTLGDNTLTHTGANDVSLTDTFAIVVTDTDGSSANDHLEVTVVDDTPTAFDNSNTVDEGGSVGGNVLSDATPDVFGADGQGGIVTFTDGVHTVAPGGTIETALGFLTINADGSYNYVSKANSTAADTHDSFTYTIVDADGDPSTAVLTIDITASTGNVSDTDVTVDESGLDNGSYHGSQLVPNGEFDTDGQITASGGTPPYTYTLTDPANGTYGTLTLNADGSYSYTLDTPFTDGVSENSRNVVNGAESFGYEVHDNLGNVIGTGTISVNIVDDVPNAVDDGTTHVAEDVVGTIGGNVMTNDVQGADTAKVTSVNIGGVDHAVAAAGTTNVSTANGDYTFKADGTWTFDPHSGLNQTGGAIDASFTYTLTDGDGDHDTATKTILIDDGAGPTGGDTLSLTVDDGALSDGNNSASTAEVASGALTFTAGSDALTSFAFGTDTSGLGAGLTWVRVDGNTITGSDGATLVVTLKLTAPASLAAGASGDVTVTATLANNYDSHPTFTADDLQALGSVTVVASDQDGDSATGTVSVSVSDDVPTLSVSGDTTVVEGSTATGTWTQSVGADSPGTTVAVFNGTEYALGTAINTGKGTLTVNSNGTWSFVSNNNLNNSVAQSITFSVKVTDVDHDVATDPQTITITDGAGPTGGDTLSLTIDDGALSDGSTPASTAEIASGQLTFTAGSDALTTFAFGNSTAGLGAGLTWVRVDDTTITGSDGATLIVTLKLTAPASIAAGASGDATVTATLANNYDSHSGINVDDLQALGSVSVVASDQDGDSATGTVSVSVSDDLPVATDDGSSLTEDTASVAGNVLSNDHFYADGPNSTQQISAVSGTAAGTVGGNTTGTYGTLHLNLDGTYTYNLNTAAVQGLDVGEHVTDTFSYTIKDADGDTSLAHLTITINGANDAPAANDDTNWVLDVASGPNPTTSGNVLENHAHAGAPSGIFADVADTDVDVEPLSVTGVTGGTVGTSLAGAHGSIVINSDGSYTYTLNASDSAVNALGAGETLTDSFTYTASDGTAIDTATVTITIFGTNDAPSVTGSAVAVSEEGLPGGNTDDNPVAPAEADTTNSATANGSITITDADTNDTFTVKLGIPTQTLHTPDGLTALTWQLSLDGHTLKGFSSDSNNPEVLVTIDDQGHYTVTLGGPVQHTNTTLEDLASFVVPVLVNDGTTTTTQSNGITVSIEDDSPVLGAFSPAANTVDNIANDTAIGTFAYSAGGDGHGSFSFTPPAITGVTYTTSQAPVDLDGDGTFTAGATLTAHAGADILFTLAVDATGHYKFTLVTPDAATQETLSFAQLSAGGPGFRELGDDAATGGVNELGRVEFTSNGTGVNANNNAFGVSNAYIDPTEFFTMEFHSPGAAGDDAAGTNSEYLESIDLNVNDLKNSPGNIGPNATIHWTATNTLSGDVETGTATVTSTGAVHIDPSITFNQMTILNYDDPALNNDGARFSISGVTIYKLVLPTDQNLDFDITATDRDGDVSATASLSILVDATPPVALDLNGDGLNFLSLDAGVTHDYGHGIVATAWVAPDDGLLAHQTGSGLDLVFTDDAAGAKTDLQGLAIAYDSNHDGQLTSADTAWGAFGVWQDANSNGVVDTGEFKTLDQAGIAAIDLTANGAGYTAADGDVTVVGTGSYTKTDGSSGSLADTVFATSTQKIGQQTTEFAAAAAALGGFIAVPVAQSAFAGATSQPATFSTMDLATTQVAAAANDVDHTDKPVSASIDLAAPHAEPAEQPASSLAVHDEDSSHEAVLPQVADNDVSPLPLPEHASPATESAIAQPAQAPSDIALMDALLAMHPAQATPTDDPAVVQVADSGSQSTQDLPAVAAVLDDALAGQVVDHILDKLTGSPTSSPATVELAQLDQHAGASDAAGGAAAHSPIALDVHLEAQAGDHAFLFAMAALPTVEEHLVAVA